MKKINICGKRGLGDLVAGTSYILKQVNSNCQLTFWLPPEFDYKRTVDTIIYQYSASFPHLLTHTVNETWSSINYYKAVEKFGVGENINWYFNKGIDQSGAYLKFKDQWWGDSNGPVGLCLNNENTNPGYPYPEKWFNEDTDNFLWSLVDNKKYIVLGRPKSVQSNIDIMKQCRYILGTDGGWAHVANAMGVPYKLVRNNMSLKILKDVHYRHPTLTIVETKNIKRYLI